MCREVDRETLQAAGEVSPHLKLTLLILLFLAVSCIGLIGCGQAPARAALPQPDARFVPEPEPEEPAPVEPSYSVLKNWGLAPSEMKLDFRDLEINRTYAYTWKGWDNDDDVGQNNLGIRTCRADIRLNGTESEGVLEIRNALMGWRYSIHIVDECTPHNGDYPYRATADGLEITYPDGSVMFAEIPN